MKVILCENVLSLGEIGATVDVSAGYARNYLFPRKLAVAADSGSAKQIEHEMRIIKRREEKRRAEMKELAKKLEGVTVEVLARAGADDKLFGSVTNAHIAAKLKDLGFDVDRRQISLAEPIKSLGIFTATVKLGQGVEAHVPVAVTKEGGEDEVQPEPEVESDIEAASMAEAEASTTPGAAGE